MQINATFDSRELLLRMQKGQKKLAYAAANAINDTAKEAQLAMQKRADDIYTVRRSTFFRRQVAIIKPFASARQGRPFAIVQVGQKPRLLLAVLEHGGVRKPAKGRRVAVPITGNSARPTFGSQVPKAFEYRTLKPARAGRKRRAGAGQVSQSFILDGPGVKQPGVYLRTGPGQVELLYAFEEPMTLKPSLRFVQTVSRVGATRLEANFEKHVKREILR